MGQMRTKETQEKYATYVAEGGLDGGCRLCEAEAIKTFSHWKIIRNDFPYDRIAEVHHMLAPLRHVGEDDMSEEEKGEWASLKRTVGEDYDLMIEATMRNKSIPDHFHLHLVVVKD
jgi:hypothetical protein